MYGMIGWGVTLLACRGGKLAYQKVKFLSEESSDERVLKKMFTKEEIKNAQQDMDFPWEKVKCHIYMNYDMDSISFDTWIDPLVCRAYNDRVLLEFPASSEMEISYIKEKYKRVVKNSILEVTGKNYIVSFVRPGEILIEDDI